MFTREIGLSRLSSTKCNLFGEPHLQFVFRLYVRLKATPQNKICKNGRPRMDLLVDDNLLRRISHLTCRRPGTGFIIVIGTIACVHQGRASVRRGRLGETGRMAVLVRRLPTAGGE